MIPVSEWKFFEGMEQRVKHLARHALENREAAVTGAPLPWDPEELAGRRAGILQELDYPARVEAARQLDPTPEQARHLELHRQWALQTLVDTHPDLHPLVQDLLARMAAFRPQVAGRDATRADLRRLLRHEPDRDLREAAWFALAPLGEAIQDDVKELIRRRELLTRTVLDTGFPSVALHLCEQDRAQVIGLLDEFERFTRKAYEEARAEVASVLDLHEVEPWDLEFGLARLGELDPKHFPAEGGTAAAREAARSWGLDPDSGIEVRTTADLPLRSLTLPLDLPGTIRVVHEGMGGIDGWRTAFRATGRAVHLAHVSARRYFLEQESPVMLEASASLLESVLHDPDWLARATGAPTRALDAHVRAMRLLRILELRRHAARTAFENLVYAHSDLEPQRLYADVMEHMLQYTRNPHVLWPTHTEFVSRPLGQFSRVLGSMIAAQVNERLRGEGASPEEAGHFLREHLFAPGAGLPWETKVLAATGRALEIGPLARELEVSFTGPTLEEAEDVSDAEAEEYFKDIDLSDLE